MRSGVAAIPLVGVLSAFAAVPVPANAHIDPEAALAPDASRPTHAIRGVVKAISVSSLVITTGSGKRMREMTFWLTPSTHREGEPTVGAIVSVRYRMEHDAPTATAVSVQPSVGVR